MLTIGFGDIVPVSSLEKIFVIIMAMIGSIVFGFTISTIGTIILNITKQMADYKKKIYDITNFMEVRHISKNL